MSPAHNPFTLFAKSWGYSSLFKTKKKRDIQEREEIPSQKILGSFGSKQVFGIVNNFSKSDQKSSATTASSPPSRLYRSAIKKYRYPWRKTINIDTERHCGVSQSMAEVDLPDGVYTFELIKPHNGHLGIQIIGGSDTSLGALFIQDILPDTPASKSEYFRIGDQILAVNDQDLVDTSHKEAFRTFTTLPAVVKLRIFRNKYSVLPRMKCKGKISSNNNEFDSHQIVDKDLQGLMDRAVGSSQIPRCVSAVIDIRLDESPGTEENEDPNSMVVGVKRHSEFFQIASSSFDPIKRQPLCYSPTYCTRNSQYPVTQTPPDSDEDIQGKVCIEPHRKLRRSNSTRSTPRESKDIITTWPLTAGKTRIAVNENTFLQPSHCSLRRSNSTRIQRSSSFVCNTDQHFLGTLNQNIDTCSSKRPKYIWKTHVIELCRSPTGWGIDVGGGVGSPYGVVPIYVRDVSRYGSAHGILRKGDEIISFSNMNFEEITYQKAIRLMDYFKKNSSTVIIRRRQLKQGTPTAPVTYAELWAPLPGNTTYKRGARPKSGAY